MCSFSLRGLEKRLYKFVDSWRTIRIVTTKEIKSEIQKSLDNVPDSVLQDILDFLKLAEKHSTERLNLTRNLRDILAEDRELLEKLA